MPKKQAPEINWLPLPEAHNYPAAESYLGLLYPPAKVAVLVADLRDADCTSFKAKDIFRASQLSLLGVSNSHVQKNYEKIANEKPLSPLLLVRDSVNGKVVVADGYHRLCAVYGLDEDISIPCKIVG